MEVQHLVFDDCELERGWRSPARSLPDDIPLDDGVLHLVIVVLDGDFDARLLVARQLPQILLARAGGACGRLDDHLGDRLGLRLTLFDRSGERSVAADDSRTIPDAPSVALLVGAHQQVEVIHPVLDLDRAAAVIDRIRHAVQAGSRPLHGHLGTECHGGRRCTSAFGCIERIAHCIQESALHRIVGRIVSGEHGLDRIGRAA